MLPKVRAHIEAEIGRIAVGEADAGVVVRHSLDNFLKKFQFFVEEIQRMDDLFELSFSKITELGKPISKCGKCRRYLKLIIARYSFRVLSDTDVC